MIFEIYASVGNGWIFWSSKFYWVLWWIYWWVINANVRTWGVWKMFALKYYDKSRVYKVMGETVAQIVESVFWHFISRMFPLLFNSITIKRGNSRHFLFYFYFLKITLSIGNVCMLEFSKNVSTENPITLLKLKINCQNREFFLKNFMIYLHLWTVCKSVFRTFCRYYL